MTPSDLDARTLPHTPSGTYAKPRESDLVEDMHATERWLGIIFAFTLLSTLFQVSPCPAPCPPFSSAAGCLPTPSPSCPTSSTR